VAALAAAVLRGAAAVVVKLPATEEAFDVPKCGCPMEE